MSVAVQAIRDAAGVIRYVWGHPANRRHRARALGRAVSFQVRGRVFNKRTVTQVGRARMWAELHHAASSKVVYGSPPDWAEMRAWERMLVAGDLFVDVGANVGSYALWACSLGADVIAIEPNREASARLRENIALNGYGIHVLEVAVADASGVVRITTDLDTVNHLVSNREGAEVPCFTLDEIVGDRLVAGVKIDVEGAERLVIEGGRRCLSEHRIKVLQLEWNGVSEPFFDETREPVAELLREFDYRLFRPSDGGELMPAGRKPPYGPDVFAVAPGIMLENLPCR